MPLLNVPSEKAEDTNISNQADDLFAKYRLHFQLDPYGSFQEEAPSLLRMLDDYQSSANEDSNLDTLKTDKRSSVCFDTALRSIGEIRKKAHGELRKIVSIVNLLERMKKGNDFSLDVLLENVEVILSNSPDVLLEHTYRIFIASPENIQKNIYKELCRKIYHYSMESGNSKGANDFLYNVANITRSNSNHFIENIISFAGSTALYIGFCGDFAGKFKLAVRRDFIKSQQYKLMHELGIT